MLCMIWAIDEAISLSPLRALPSLSLSPCCLMFQFGGSKHSIRQINCLMHVISQTVYERGAPRPGAASPPPTAATSFSLPCSPRAHCLLSYRRAHPGCSPDAEASLCTHKCKKHIFTHAHTHSKDRDAHKNLHNSYTYTSICMHEKPHADIHINIVETRAQNVLGHLQPKQQTCACFKGTRITCDIPCNANATYTDVLKDTSTDSLTMIVKLLYTIKSCSLNR